MVTQRRYSLALTPLLGLALLLAVLLWLADGPPAGAGPLADCVAGPHSGTLASSQDWCPADNPHVLSGDVVVPTGVTLTLRPGVIVQGGTQTRIGVSSGGHLEAAGEPAQPITLTSATDSGPGQWEGLYLVGSATLRHVTLRYAGQYDGWTAGAIRINMGSLLLESSQVVDNALVGSTDYGLHMCCGISQAVISDTLLARNGDSASDYALYNWYNSEPLTVVNSRFEDNSGYPLHVSAASAVRLSGNEFRGNNPDRVLVRGGEVTGGGTLADESGLQAYELVDSELRVPVGAVLQIDPGVTVMGRSGIRIQVNGTLEAVGAPAEPITLTSATDSGPGQWPGLYVTGAATLRHVTLRYAGQNDGWAAGALRVNGGSLLLESSQLVDNALVGSTDYGLHMCCGTSQAVISDTLVARNGDSAADYALYNWYESEPLTVVASQFLDNSGYPLHLNAASVINLRGNTYGGNNPDRVLVRAGSLAADGALAAESGLEAYELVDGLLRVPAGRALRIDPGVTVMGRNGGGLQVLGHLEAVGTVGQPILLTSAADSGPYQWSGLDINTGSAELAHLTLRYAGQSDGYTYSGLTVRNASGPVTLSHVQVLSNSAPSLNDYGLYVVAADLTIADSLLAGNGDSSSDTGLYAYSGTVLTMTGSTLRDNAGRGLVVHDSSADLTCSTVADNGAEGVFQTGFSSAWNSLSAAIYGNGLQGYSNASSNLADARYTWWGDPSGPGGVGPGSGDEVSANVLYDPWLPQAACLADLSVTMSDDPDPAVTGLPLTYTLVIVNDGPGAASGVTLTDTLPAGMQLGVAQGSQGSCAGDSLVTCALGELAAGSRVTVTLTVTPTTAGVLTNTAQIAGLLDPITLNNSASEVTTIEFDGYLVFLPLALSY